jgi:hypothetical protein
VAAGVLAVFLCVQQRLAEQHLNTNHALDTAPVRGSTVQRFVGCELDGSSWQCAQAAQSLNHECA